MNSMSGIVAHWLPLAIIITGLCGFIVLLLGSFIFDALGDAWRQRMMASMAKK